MEFNTLNDSDIKPVFVKDNFMVEGVIFCKFIHSKFTEELKKKTGKDKLKFNLVDDPCNNQILTHLKNKEIYFLKKTVELAEMKYPISVKTFLNDNGDITILESKKIGDELFVKKKYLEKTETNTTVSDKITSVSLKVGMDINCKNIKNNNTNSKLSIADLMELSKSEQLKLKIQIKCSAVFNNNCLYISGTLMRISIDDSKLSQIYLELKEKENETKDKKLNLLPRDKMYISKYPTKSSTIVDNVVNIISNNSDSSNDSNSSSNRNKIIKPKTIVKKY